MINALIDFIFNGLIWTAGVLFIICLTKFIFLIKKIGWHGKLLWIEMGLFVGKWILPGLMPRPIKWLYYWDLIIRRKK